MKRTFIKLMVYISILIILPLSVFAGTVCNHNSWQLTNTKSSYAINDNYHTKIEIKNYICTKANCKGTKQETVKSSPEPHSYRPNGLHIYLNQYDSIHHLVMDTRGLICQCGKTTSYTNITTVPHSWKKTAVGQRSDGSTKYRYSCPCGYSYTED